MPGLHDPRFSLFRSALAAAVLACACSDDTAVPARDAAADSGEPDPGNLIPRRDAQVQEEDPVPPCDRFSAGSCAPGQVCEEVARYDATADAFFAYTGCVNERSARGLGDPCTPWTGFQQRYLTPGLTDEVYVDPCGPGLLCARDPHVRDHSSCQPVCQSGVFGDAPVPCQSKSAFCTATARFQEVCRESDGCNPSTQAGCKPGRACYLRLNDRGDGALSVCLLAPDAPLADGAACEYIDDCRPGSSCFGPVGSPVSSWTAADFRCRSSCTAESLDAGPSGADAGEDDAGLGSSSPAGPCGSAAQCVPYATTAFDWSAIPSPPYGQCEP